MHYYSRVQNAQNKTMQNTMIQNRIKCKQCNNTMKQVLFDNGLKHLTEGYHCYCCGMNRIKINA